MSSCSRLLAKRTTTSPVTKPVCNSPQVVMEATPTSLTGETQARRRRHTPRFPAPVRILRSFYPPPPCRPPGCGAIGVRKRVDVVNGGHASPLPQYPGEKPQANKISKQTWSHVLIPSTFLFRAFHGNKFRNLWRCRMVMAS